MLKSPQTDMQTKAEVSLDPMHALTKISMQKVNQVILERMDSQAPLIPELAGHLIAAGGKRMRPMLTLIGALAGAEQNHHQELADGAVYLAAAVEFIHNATLLHDDVIDNSQKRRGRDTANALWGNEVSVLVGDFLFARAFELMVQTGDLSVLGMLSSASIRITEGEVQQMAMIGVPSSPMEDYLSVITNKTAILFAAAAESGCRIGGGSQQLCSALHNYGLALGRAFQICDDALDYEAGPKDTGKNIGDDFYEGKITMPIILAWQDGDESEREFWQNRLGAPDICDGDLDKARAILAHHKAISRSLNAAREEAESAIMAIAPLASGQLKSALIEGARFAAGRAY